MRTLAVLVTVVALVVVGLCAVVCAGPQVCVEQSSCWVSGGVSPLHYTGPDVRSCLAETGP
jgi:NO-binding membrane sensor protein with MHYT domain